MGFSTVYMGQILACVINRSDLMQSAVRYEQEILDQGPFRQADSWGLGFYQANEVLHKKHPRPLESSIDWSGIFDGVRSHVGIAHIRNATNGSVGAANVHPFRMRQWLFAHAGEIGGFDAIRDRLLESLPDFIQRNIRGESDSEHIFHVLLSFLHDAGQLTAVDAAPQAVIGAVRSTVTLLDRLGSEVGAPKPVLNMVFTNGRQLYAFQRGAPLAFVERDRLPLSDSPPRDTKRRDQVRYVLVASHAPEALAPGYRPIGAGELLRIERDVRVELESI